MTESQKSWSNRLRAMEQSESHNRRPLTWGLVIGLGIGAVVAYFAFAESGPVPRLYKVEPTTFEVALTETGILEAKQVTEIRALHSGDIAWLVDEGTRVKKGDRITVLDVTPFNDELERAKNSLEPLLADLQVKELQLSVQEERHGLLVKKRENAVAQREWELERQLQRPLKEELERARQDQTIAKLRHDSKTKTYNDYISLHKQGAVTAQELKRARLGMLRAGIDMRRAEIRMSFVKQGATKLQLQVARQNVATTKLNLQLAKSNRDADVLVARQNVRLANVYKAKNEKWIERIERKIKESVIVSPTPGTVVFDEVWKGWGTKGRMQVGDSVHGGTEICKIADVSALRSRQIVNEVDIQSVEVGQPARASLIAYPDVPITGAVSSIGLMATDKNSALGHLALQKSGMASVNVVEVKVDLDRARPDFRLGMTVQVTIVLEKKENVLAVPISAVSYTDGGQPYCLRRRGGSYVPVPVTLGKEGGLKVVVESGLEMGNEVVEDVDVWRAATNRASEPPL